VIVGIEVGEIVGELEPHSQSTAAPGSNGGTQIDGLAELLGCSLGERDGIILGSTEGIVEGLVEGTVEGTVEGIVEGTVDGAKLGVALGVALGAVLGASEAAIEGAADVSVTCNLLTSFSRILSKRLRSLGGGQGYSKTS
jgi:hypothetical protein